MFRSTLLLADIVDGQQFRLESPIDTNRLLAPGRPQPEGDVALMFPYDLAVWRDNVFVLGLPTTTSIPGLPGGYQLTGTFVADAPALR